MEFEDLPTKSELDRWEKIARNVERDLGPHQDGSESCTIRPWQIYKLIAAARAAIEPDWLPIDTAEKDGEWQLLGFFGDWIDGFPPAQIGIWDGEQWSGDWTLDDMEVKEYAEAQPTHWAPVFKIPNLVIETRAENERRSQEASRMAVAERYRLLPGERIEPPATFRAHNLIMAFKLPETGDPQSYELSEFIRASDGKILTPADGPKSVLNSGGTMAADPGDWIIRGADGEYFACSPEEFDTAYAAELEKGEANG